MYAATLVLAAFAALSTANPLRTPMARQEQLEPVIEEYNSKPTHTSRQEGSPSCSLIPSSPTNGLSLAVQPGFAGFVRTQDITFTIPTILPGGCQLEARFPAGYAISSSGDAQVNVIAKGGNAPGAIVGTTTFTSDPSQARKIFINSFACETEMAYTLELAGAEGTVDFLGTEEAGLFMAVGNCW